MERSEYIKSLPRKWMGSGALFTNDHGDVLIVKPTYKEYWEIPGGSIQEDESPAAACAREVKEELGFVFTPGRLLIVDYVSNTDGNGDRLMFVFDGGVIGDRAIQLPPEELSECAFIKIEDAATFFNDRLARRIPKAVEALKSHSCLYLENGEAT